MSAQQIAEIKEKIKRAIDSYYSNNAKEHSQKVDNEYNFISAITDIGVTYGLYKIIQEYLDVQDKSKWDTAIEEALKFAEVSETNFEIDM